MRVGITGVGLSARIFHIPLLRCFPEVQIVSVCSSKSEQQISQLIHGQPQPQFSPKIHEHFEDFLRDDSYELAIVLTPTHHHFEACAALLKQGKHVLVDKPMATSLSELQELSDIQNRSGKILSVFQNRRQDSDFLTIQNAINHKLAGELFYLESRFDKYRPQINGRWREQALKGSGILFDIGSHLIDQALQLFGLPFGVQAEISASRKDAIVDDNYKVNLIYANHTVCLRTSSLAATTPFRFYLEGDQGTIQLSGNDTQEHALENGFYSSNSNWIKQENIKCELHNQSGKTPVGIQHGDYRKMYQELFNGIDNNQNTAVGIKDAMNIQYIIALARLSSDIGRTLKPGDYPLHEAYKWETS